MHKVLIKTFATIRKKNLFVFLIIPSFFMLRKYLAIFRARFLIHCYSPDGVQRGYYGLYNRTTKRKLYIRGIKEMDMNVVKPNKRGRFTDTYGYFYSPEIYEAKKDEAIASILQGGEEKYLKELKEKYNKAVNKLKEYRKQYKEKCDTKLKDYKKKYHDNIKEIRETFQRKLYDLGQKIKISKTGKIDEELKTLVDFRDCLIYNVFRDQDTNAILEILRKYNITHYSQEAISSFYERGKNLTEIKKDTST